MSREHIRSMAFFEERIKKKLANPKKYPLERVNIYELHEVLPFVFYHEDPDCQNTEQKKYGEHSIWMNSQRLQLFDKKGTICKYCKLKGTYFVAEKHGEEKRPHFNLYGKNKEGEEIMLTKDHVIPKSKGGINALSNYQVLCERCNTAKGDNIIGSCSIEDCDIKQHAKGLCRKHYETARRRTKGILPRNTKPRICSVEGCSRKYHAKGHCRIHYRRWKETGTTEIPPRKIKLCSVEECGRVHAAKGLCARHYTKKYDLTHSRGIPKCLPANLSQGKRILWNLQGNQLEQEHFLEKVRVYATECEYHALYKHYRKTYCESGRS